LIKTNTVPIYGAELGVAMAGENYINRNEI